MIRLFCAAVLVLTAPAALAQADDPVLQGTVRYEVRTKMTIGTLPPEMEALRAQLEREHVETRTVRFAGATAVSTTPAQADASGDPAEGVQLRMNRTATHFYVDADRGVRASVQELMDRTFRIEEPFKPLPWRLTGEASTFLGYEVQQATADSPRGTVEAWFAPEIPAPVGPDGFAGLPGLVLLVTEGGGRRAFTAVDIDLSPLAALPAPPTEGRPVSRAEFERIQEERDEQRRRMGGGNVITIRPN